MKKIISILLLGSVLCAEAAVETNTFTINKIQSFTNSSAFLQGHLNIIIYSFEISVNSPNPSNTNEVYFKVSRGGTNDMAIHTGAGVFVTNFSWVADTRTPLLAGDYLYWSNTITKAAKITVVYERTDW